LAADLIKMRFAKWKQVARLADEAGFASLAMTLDFKQTFVKMILRGTK